MRVALEPPHATRTAWIPGRRRPNRRPAYDPRGRPPPPLVDPRHRRRSRRPTPHQLPQGLAKSPLSLVIGFAEQLSRALYRLDRKEYGHNLSDDAFLYTRAAVVAAGRTVFDSVLQDPTVFTPYATDPTWAELLLYTPDRAYKRITGEEWDRDTRYSFESCSNIEGWAD
ncbi:DUF4240 domain-containing protein [Streptomyces goshikiensis]|uniref:DUF4240 domain-containing protein n=1 Tax=Streptomyces goshikiensis TaxID=1942 RepID=UPI0016724431|nr:DUF4240 domain-containing protein [Streptomyces goshikiensis]